MRSYSTLPFALLTLGLVLSSCSKDEDPPAPTPPVDGGGGGSNETPSTTPNFADADASLWAIRAFNTQTTPIGTFDIEIGTAVAVFSNDNFSSMLSAGTVELNDHALTAQSNNAYVFTPSAADPMGLDLSSGTITWEVSGSSDFDGFTHTYVNNDFPNPSIGEITSGTTVVRADGYTLVAGAVNNADSVLFMVGDVVVTRPGGTTSHTFSASDLSGLGTGQNLVQVVPYAFRLQILNGKNVYFGKEMVRSRSVSIQ